MFDLFAVVALIVVVVGIISAVSGPRQAGLTFLALDLSGVVALAVFIALGRGLKGLKPWAKWVTAALVSLSLLTSLGSVGVLLVIGGGPTTFEILAMIGQSLILGYILYLILFRKGSYVFSHEYSMVVRATPHIKYKTSCILKAALGLLILIVIIVFAVALSSR